MSASYPPVDPTHMDLALEFARQSYPSPNPRVGAVVVQRGQVIGRGYHERPGKPHAEVLALKEAGSGARGADLYVTLEPCCHHGNTGPCVGAIRESGLARVIVGMVDPDPRVKGHGIQLLKEAGIEVVVGVRQDDCERLLAGYSVHRKQGRPLITLKVAMTLDGKLATLSGDSKWISSEESRRLAHQMRAEADAVLVGVGTVLKDDPTLTVRLADGPNPLRVIVDSHLKTPLDSKLVQTASEATLLFAYTDAPQERIKALAKIQGIETLRCKSHPDGRVLLRELASKLGKKGIVSLLVEGGSKIHGSFVEEKLADAAAIFFAPKILGSGIDWISFSGIDSIKDGIELENSRVTEIGGDLLIETKFLRNPER